MISWPLFLLFAIFAASAVQVHAQTVTMEEGLLIFFEQFRCRMIYEQENIDIPKLEPFEEEKMTVKYSDEAFGSMQIQLKNLRVEGLSTFHVPDLMFDLFTLDFWLYLEVPKLTVSGWYSISGDMQDMIELRGSGDFEMVIEGINCFMDGSQGHNQTDNSWWMNRMSMEFGIEKLTGHMAGIMDDEVLEDFFNYILNNAAPELIETVFPDIEPMIVEVAKDMVPELLNGMHILEVLDIILLETEFFMTLPEEECPVVYPEKDRLGKSGRSRINSRKPKTV